MRSFLKLNISLCILSGCVAMSGLQAATNEMEAALQAIEATTPVSADAAPQAGNFYSAQYFPGSEGEWPPLPADILGLNVWSLGDGIFLLDDRNVNYSTLSDDDTPMSFFSATFTTNDLWLEITGETNSTAYLVIHAPWNVTNGVYDLLYTTNLASPIQWQWVLRTDPGQTNVVASNAVDAQGFYRLGPPNDFVANDSLGTNFWVAFMYMYSDYMFTNKLSLYISSPVAVTGTVTIPGFGITNMFTLAAGSVTNITVGTNIMISSDYDDVIETNGIHITTTGQPVSVYGFDYYPAVSAAFTCYPTPLLGTNYCIMARPSFYNVDESEFAVVATANDTAVTITPSPSADLDGYLWTNTIVLHQGQTYQIDSSEATDDVTGTWITSDKPVAVFAGADIAKVPDVYTSAGNPLVQEQLPVESWGTQALSMGFAGRTNGDSYRVLAAYDNTLVTITGAVVTVAFNEDDGTYTITTSNQTVEVTNMAGGFYDIIIQGPVQFQADQPIQVAHFANGSYFDHSTEPFEGDPCDILLPPIDRYLVTNTVFTLPNDGVAGDFNKSYFNLVVAQSAILTTFVDGSIIAATNFVAIGMSGYYGAQLTVTNSGTHKVASSQPIGVEIYGFGEFDAYGYFGGIVK